MLFRSQQCSLLPSRFSREKINEPALTMLLEAKQSLHDLLLFIKQSSDGRCPRMIRQQNDRGTGIHVPAVIDQGDTLTQRIALGQLPGLWSIEVHKSKNTNLVNRNFAFIGLGFCLCKTESGNLKPKVKSEVASPKNENVTISSWSGTMCCFILLISPAAKSILSMESTRR